jgi:hypothetical protein
MPPAPAERGLGYPVKERAGPIPLQNVSCNFLALETKGITNVKKQQTEKLVRSLAIPLSPSARSHPECVVCHLTTGPVGAVLRRPWFPWSAGVLFPRGILPATRQKEKAEWDKSTRLSGGTTKLSQNLDQSLIQHGIGNFQESRIFAPYTRFPGFPYFSAVSNAFL